MAKDQRANHEKLFGALCRIEREPLGQRRFNSIQKHLPKRQLEIIGGNRSWLLAIG